jgi:hypothetical protein
MKDDERTRALLAIIQFGEAEIRRGQFQDIDQFLAELEREDEGGAHGDA